MVEVILKQCYFCEAWFPADKVEAIKLQRHPASSYEEVFACADCVRHSRIDNLIAKAATALQTGSFNEIELTHGGLKVHLVRFTPTPYYPGPFTAPWGL